MNTRSVAGAKRSKEKPNFHPGSVKVHKEPHVVDGYHTGWYPPVDTTVLPLTPWVVMQSELWGKAPPPGGGGLRVKVLARAFPTLAGDSQGPSTGLGAL